MLTVRRMIELYMKENGYDGLCSLLGECACKLSDFIPCNDLDIDECQPGKLVEGCICGRGCSFHIVPNG